MTPEALRFQVEDWLEWEETVLRPAAQGTNPSLLQSALDKLAEALSASTFLVGKAITLADVAVFSTLLSVMDTAQVCKMWVAEPICLDAEGSSDSFLDQSLSWNRAVLIRIKLLDPICMLACR